MTTIDIDPEEIADAAKALRSAIDGFADRLTTFQASIEPFADAWGDDDIGSILGPSYDAVSSYAFDCFTEAIDEVTAAAEDLEFTAEAYSDIETTIDTDISGLGDRKGL